MNKNAKEMSEEIGIDWHETTESINEGKHGTDYEIEISTFLLKRLLDNDFKNFKFTREKRGLGKFDDLTYIYESEDRQKKFCLVQLKHISDETKKIGYKSLAEDKNSYFSLPKYFNYYLDSIKTISSDKDFVDSELEGLILCTNIELENDLSGIEKDRVENSGIFKNSGTLYKLRISNADKRKIFAESYLSERKKLANELAYYIMLNKDIDVNCLKINDHVSMIKTCHVALAKDVIDINTKKIKSTFLEDNLKENVELCQFRDCFFQSISEFCANYKDLNAEELGIKLKIRLKNSEELKNRLSDYELVNSVQEFLKKQTINIRSSFGNASKFPDDDAELPTGEPNVNEVDNQINNFLEKLIFALEQNNNKNIIRREMGENIFTAFSDKMNQWYHHGSFKDCKGSSIRKREWLSKEKLLSHALETTIKFQERDLKLNQLASDQNLIDSDTLLRAFCSLSINIGNELAEFGDIRNYYVTRTLTRQKVIHKNVLKMSENDIFLLSHVEKEWNKDDVRKHLPENETLNNIKNVTDKCRFIFTGRHYESKDFDIFVNTYSEKFKWTNVHWVKYQGKYLMWEQTYGSLSELRNHFRKTDKPLELVNENELRKSDCFVILTGEPGMGKSTLVSHIAEGFAKSNDEKESPHWIIKISLKDSDKILDELESLQNLDDVTEFLSFFENVENNIGKNLLKHFIANEGRIILLLDGFDELYSEDNQEKIINFLKFLKLKSRVKRVYLTTRPHFKESLENCLGVISYSIKEISEDEQICFLTRYWGQITSRSDEQIAHYTKDLIRKFSSATNVREISFLGIPLQTYMFAVVFQQEALKDNPDIPESLPITSLFEKFLNTKYEIYLEKSGETTMKNKRKQQLQLKSYDNLHQDFAFRYGGIVSSEDAEVFITQSNPPEFEILLDIGIVYKFNDTFHFAHKTFAEYLTVKRLVEVALNLNKYNVNCRKVLAKLFLKPGNEFLRYLFDLKLTEKFPIHSSVLNRDEMKVRNFNDDEINAEDCLGRRPLNYAIRYSTFNIIKSLCDKRASMGEDWEDWGENLEEDSDQDRESDWKEVWKQLLNKVLKEFWRENWKEHWDEQWKKHWQEHWKKVLKEFLKKFLKEFLNEVLKNALKEVWKEVLTEVLKEIWKKDWNEDWEEVCQKVWEEVWEEDWEEVWEEVGKEVREEIQEKIREEVVQEEDWNEVWREVSKRIWNEFWEEVREELWEENCDVDSEEDWRKIKMIRRRIRKLIRKLIRRRLEKRSQGDREEDRQDV